MKALLRISYFVIVYGLLYSNSHAEGSVSSSPYFQVIGKGADVSNEVLPLKSSAATVTIDGTIARVHLSQRYANSGSVPIEAIYVFPASTRAAVHGMTLRTGGRQGNLTLVPLRTCTQRPFELNGPNGSQTDPQ